MSHKLSILIVDDDLGMVKTLADILRFYGYPVETARSGPEALEKAVQGRFDCLLTDIKMPGMNGVELHRAIREVRPELPVVFISAYATGELVQLGLREGAIGVLSKPLDVDLLLNYFSSLLGESPNIDNQST